MRVRSRDRAGLSPIGSTEAARTVGMRQREGRPRPEAGERQKASKFPAGFELDHHAVDFLSQRDEHKAGHPAKCCVRDAVEDHREDARRMVLTLIAHRLPA